MSQCSLIFVLSCFLCFPWDMGDWAKGSCLLEALIYEYGCQSNYFCINKLFLQKHSAELVNILDLYTYMYIQRWAAEEVWGMSLHSCFPNWIPDFTPVERPPKVAHLYLVGHETSGPAEGISEGSALECSAWAWNLKWGSKSTSYTFSTCGGIPFAGNSQWFQILDPNPVSSFELNRLLTILEALK